MKNVNPVGRLARLIGVFAITCLPLPARAQNSAPVVTNVVAQQIAGTGLVRVTYDVSDADGDSLIAYAVFSSNNGAAYDLLPVSVSGDVNRWMVAGPGKQITWNAALDFPGRYWSQVVARVTVSDGPASGGEMMFVPAGNFTMGSTQNPEEQPVHTVYLDAFYIDKYEVTNAEFERFIGAGGYTTQALWSPAGWSWRTANNITEPYYWSSGANHSGPAWPGFPVVGVSWYEAEAYANFAGKRLPTEAEWEKAARSTDARTYPWGEGIDGSRANYQWSGDPYEAGSTPVGFYNGNAYPNPPNPPFQTTNSPGLYGAYDQAGNVYEWVKDWYSSTYYSQSPPSNPQGPLSGTCRVLRGGSWDDDTVRLRCARRVCNPSASRGNASFGFRCARTL